MPIQEGGLLRQFKAIIEYNVDFQVNKPITESPLLMSSYISHLSQYRCSNWDETVSVLRSDPVKTNTNIFPKFDMLEEGLSCIKMATKEASLNTLFDEKDEANLTPKQTHVFDWDKSVMENSTSNDESNESNDHEKPDTKENLNSSDDQQEYCVLSDATSKTTIIVKFKGE